MNRPRPPDGERRARSTVVTVLGLVAILVGVAVVAMAVAPGLFAPQAGPPASTTDDATPDAAGQPADGDTTAGDVDGTDAGASSSGDAGTSTATPVPDANATGSDGTATDSAGAASDGGSASGGASTDDDGTDGAASGGADGGESDGSGSDAADEAATGPRFSLVVGEVTECGAVCRDVTATVTNEGDERATGVTVETQVFAGGDRVWQGTADLGTVDAGESVSRTQRVNVGYFGAAKIQANDGRVTIRTTVRWDGGEETFSERVDVS